MLNIEAASHKGRTDTVTKALNCNLEQPQHIDGNVDEALQALFNFTDTGRKSICWKQ